MYDKEKEINEVLAGVGLRSTKQRKAIMHILSGYSVPVSADEIYIKLRENQISACLSTVYRTLDTLVSNNLVKKTILMGDECARYELVRNVHNHHLVCLKCHKMVPIEECPLEELQKKLQMETNFEVKGHQLEMYGICPDCKVRGSNTDTNG